MAIHKAMKQWKCNGWSDRSKKYSLENAKLIWLNDGRVKKSLENGIWCSFQLTTSKLKSIGLI